jgi:hypothetical protein
MDDVEGHRRSQQAEREHDQHLVDRMAEKLRPAFHGSPRDVLVTGGQ